MSRAIPERVTQESDDDGRHHVAFAVFGVDFTRFLPLVQPGENKLPFHDGESRVE